MKKFPIPILILAAFAALSAALLVFQPKPEKSDAPRPLANVEVLTVHPENIQLSVTSQGTALPLTESDLAIEVSGRVIAVAEDFRPGGYFKKGDVLLEIDPLDYRAALAARAAELAQAKLALAQEKALSDQAKADWKSIGKGEPSPLTLRLPQLEYAEAAVASARAAHERATADLAKTKVRAPYDGRVLQKNIDLGQLAAPNSAAPAARLYATEVAEVRLPITEREAAFLRDPSESAAPVQLNHNNRQWNGTLTRIEATIDPQNRLLYAVAEVKDPYHGPHPLRRGLFVDAVIEGRNLQGAYQIPRLALRGSNTVYVLSENNTLQTREVRIVKRDPHSVIIESGLQPGEQVAVSPIAYFIENMPVNILPSE
ncbi:MAG: efflux RND transporter periplasmic adaptor subunit [Opitutales bacterium]